MAESLARHLLTQFLARVSFQIFNSQSLDLVQGFKKGELAEGPALHGNGKFPDPHLGIRDPLDLVPLRLVPGAMVFPVPIRLSPNTKISAVITKIPLFLDLISSPFCLDVS